MPVCWTRRDGGWAADVWEWWVTGVGTVDPMNGIWGIDWAAFATVVPRAVREDDETRLDVVRGLQTIAHTMNNPNQSMMPDQPE